MKILLYIIYYLCLVVSQRLFLRRPPDTSENPVKNDWDGFAFSAQFPLKIRGFREFRQTKNHDPGHQSKPLTGVRICCISASCLPHPRAADCCILCRDPRFFTGLYAAKFPTLVSQGPKKRLLHNAKFAGCYFNA